MTTGAAPASFVSDAALKRLQKRKAADRRLKYYGLGAIGIALLLLATLVTSLIITGHTAFLQTHVTYPVYLDPAKIDAQDPDKGNYRSIVRDSFAALFPDVTGVREKRALSDILTSAAPYILRDKVVADPELIGETIDFTVPVSDPFDQFMKGNIKRETAEDDRRVTNQEIAWVDRLMADGRLSKPFNTGLLTNADSRFPEMAGLAGAITGSFFALLVCFLISFPTGIAAAVYLEEFAPKNKFTDLIEVNINNLAAVPSVVFGLLGLAVFLGTFGLPRSAPLVGGMTLALMTLPTIIITTRASLKAVPPSIREAALGIGASKHQVMMHHVVPLAMPGILTGTIIGLAQALGETAPLLLIGMNAFITSPPGGILDPSTALPTQIFIWADSPERGFVSRTSAAILVLLGFLIAMNAIAIYLRRKFERRW
ncbi:phosphate ABC transporter permease PstA [Tepidicaulis marinus]|uniref:Phosphate transport system permease protein PstA n=1 Tax=Tepidicaulis marinus TaxID=1333998 RepID=A0A081BBX1_9HYPH|nr:phosphate ABC transporter permease PstA [Tepidicaulis marinus]